MGVSDKNRGVVTGINTWTLFNTRNFRYGIKVSSTLVSNRPSLIMFPLGPPQMKYLSVTPSVALRTDECISTKYWDKELYFCGSVSEYITITSQ